MDGIPFNMDTKVAKFSTATVITFCIKTYKYRNLNQAEKFVCSPAWVTSCVLNCFKHRIYGLMLDYQLTGILTLPQFNSCLPVGIGRITHSMGAILSVNGYRNHRAVRGLSMSAVAVNPLLRTYQNLKIKLECDSRMLNAETL